MASIYANHFPCAELNSTFFRCPRPGELEALADQTAPEFQYSLKVPRTITHEHRIHDLQPFKSALDELCRSHRLIGVVAQFPESFRDTGGNREWVERVVKGMYPYPIWVEFRSSTWHRAKLGEWLRQRGAELVAIDVPEMGQVYPRGVVDRGSSRLYIRLYSRDAAAFAGPAKTRYDYDYSDEMLRDWVAILREAAPRLREAFVVFNNCHGTEAIQNAIRMAELIDEMAPELHTVHAPGPMPMRQGLLYG